MILTLASLAPDGWGWLGVAGGGVGVGWWKGCRNETASTKTPTKPPVQSPLAPRCEQEGRRDDRPMPLHPLQNALSDESRKAHCDSNTHCRTIIRAKRVIAADPSTSPSRFSALRVHLAHTTSAKPRQPTRSEASRWGGPLRHLRQANQGSGGSAGRRRLVRAEAPPRAVTLDPAREPVIGAQQVRVGPPCDPLWKRFLPEQTGILEVQCR